MVPFCPPTHLGQLCEDTSSPDRTCRADGQAGCAAGGCSPAVAPYISGPAPPFEMFPIPADSGGKPTKAINPTQ